MRQGQQNRRGRGRGSNNNNNNNSSNNNPNNHRKPQNSLSRSYESSGPDVKIRGTAAQIAEKYIALARDASAAGDTVQAENYLQHAEHYNRIIMAAQAQLQPQPQPGGYHAGENGHAMNGVHRPAMEANGVMRDQPQPRIPQHQAPQPSVQPSVEIVEAAEPAPAPAAAAVVTHETDQPTIEEAPKEAAAAKDEPAAEPETGRRRRRRYPAGTNGTSRAQSAEAGAANGKAIDVPEDGRSSDEALA